MWPCHRKANVWIKFSTAKKKKKTQPRIRGGGRGPTNAGRGPAIRDVFGDTPQAPEV